MNDERRKRLTEYLGECWSPDRVCPACYAFHQSAYRRKDVKEGCTCSNRSFTTDADMMAVYRAIYRDGKWEEFTTYSNEVWWVIDAGSYAITEEEIANYTAYLFCLDGKGYEERCKMVSEFYGWEEGE